MVKNHVKSLPKKKWTRKENEETLKTLIRYIIGDSLKKKKFFLGQKQRKILTKKKQKIWSKTM